MNTFLALATVAALLAQAEALQDRDPAAARRLVDEALASPAISNVDRAHALSDRCWWTEDPAQARAFAEKGLAVALAATDGKRYAELLSCRGNSYENSGELQKALDDYRAARTASEKIGDRAGVADTYAESGYILYTRGDLNEALVDLQKAYDLSTELGRVKGQRTALAYIAHTYADPRIGQYDKAIEYYRQLLPQYEAAGAKTSVADTLFNLGSTYERKNDLGSALLWYRRALKAEEAIGRRGEAAYVERSIAVSLAKMGRSAEALPLLDAALGYFVKSGETENETLTRQSRGVVLRKLGRIHEAIADLESSRSRYEAMKNTRFLEKTNEELALAYAAAGRWQEAFEARSRQLDLQRQLAENLRDEHTSRLRVQFDAQKKESENRVLLREAAMRTRALDAAARIRRLQTIVLVLGGAVILALVYLVLRELRDARRMRVMAMTDELTRLPNRRNLLAAGEEELARARESRQPFSFIAFDIDHFKRVNDTWGHAAGDLVLQRIAHACRSAIRPGDRIGRTGGEEFAVLLPNTHICAAQSVAERLRAAAEAVVYADIDPSVRVTISLGVTEWTPADTTLAKVAGRADEVLYRAKEGGRNRVELAVA
jgi:diguanylate cyclase (GGDEF)-like protein